jgi:hypothetical protein
MLFKNAVVEVSFLKKVVTNACHVFSLLQPLPTCCYVSWVQNFIIYVDTCPEDINASEQYTRINLSENTRNSAFHPDCIYSKENAFSMCRGWAVLTKEIIPVSLAVTVLTVRSRFSHFIDKLLRSSSDLCYLNYINIILFRIDQFAVLPFLLVCWVEYLQWILYKRKFG